jgi:hypothetical protein
MTREEINSLLVEEWPDNEFLLLDGFEEAFIGVVYGKMNGPVTCYDRGKCISILMGGKETEMTNEEAEEYFSFNVDDAFVGHRTPVFLVRP